MSTRKPHNQDAGYIAEKRFRGAHIVIYRAAEQGIDTGGKKYAVVCAAHGSIVSDTSLPQARLTMKYPAFCAACMAGEGLGESGNDPEPRHSPNNVLSQPHEV